MRFFSAIIFCFSALAASAQHAVPELPNLPVSPISQSDIDKLLENDTAQAWGEYAEKTRATTLDLALKQLYPEAAGWLYVYKAADLFSKEGASLHKAVKRAMLSDIPALCDFFETMKPEDNLEGVCKTLAQIHQVYPDNFKKYLRSAFAVALVYDVPPPGGWPNCGTPSDPVPMFQAEETFNIFTEDPHTFVFPMDRLTVGELIWVFGIGGPLDELRGLKNTSIAPFAIEKLAHSIKTDKSRHANGTVSDWDTTEREFTPKNILKYGGTEAEKVYCAWRIANANGIPCLFFREGNQVWLTYMSRPGVWKRDVARSEKAKHLFGRPLDPQTWKTSQKFDIDMLARRHITTETGIFSRVFLEISRMLYDAGKYNDAAVFADKARKENPENWEAYIAFISARARFGASQGELDSYWRKSYEAFRRYPDMCIAMLNFYRQNLIALRRGKEADRLLTAEMRGVMRSDTGLGIDIYANQISDMFARAEDKTEILPAYQDIVRNSTSCPDECLRKITTPLAKLFVSVEDYRSANKVVSMFVSASRDELSKARAEKLRETLTPPKKAKPEKEEE